ncbi:hypothetical protein FVE85_3381 [Porphyridium purpureum]|uniref:Uncharacterized protein n=1 Tax=Porphyridium purpureum TaxID=35688 RepID=A0A5J4YW42_PORPP|nr:hypothetical protein FVE85_3381 [Porphyridium purpureum]|eukprot:POR0482..scf227_4
MSLDDVVGVEEQFYALGVARGAEQAELVSFRAGYMSGYERGAALNQELAFCRACARTWKAALRRRLAQTHGIEDAWMTRSFRALAALDTVLTEFDVLKTASEGNAAEPLAANVVFPPGFDVDGAMIQLRAQFRRASALLADSHVRVNETKVAAAPDSYL